MSKNENQLDHQMRSIMLTPDGMDKIKNVKISFDADVDVEPEEGEEDSRKKSTEYSAKSQHVPHKDMYAALAALLDHALAACEFEVTATNKKDFTVIGLKIKGDINLNQARVQLIMAKKVYRSEELYILPPTPELALNDTGNYLSWKDLKTKVDKVIKEVTEYMNGKHHDDETPLAYQLTLALKTEKEPEPKEKKKSERRREKTPVVNDIILPEVMSRGATA
jgi:hypothetical protein